MSKKRCNCCVEVFVRKYDIMTLDFGDFGIIVKDNNLMVYVGESYEEMFLHSLDSFIINTLEPFSINLTREKFQVFHNVCHRIKYLPKDRLINLLKENFLEQMRLYYPR